MNGSDFLDKYSSILIIFITFDLHNVSYIMAIHWDESIKIVVQTTCDQAAKHISLTFIVTVHMICQF